ncbi:hypothetical protein HA075_02930 [bacterium BFN5]|nr:hypothetical protein HA075_02705 [bacterium BFN5]QJW44880.1 hypothetical protein HA075_02930 [bacterium BFN5]
MEKLVIIAIGLVAVGYIGNLIYQQVWGNKGCGCSSGGCCSKNKEHCDSKEED